jgi:surface polysaccharide O-acyltransferase-like enzyme
MTGRMTGRMDGKFHFVHDILYYVRFWYAIHGCMMGRMMGRMTRRIKGKLHEVLYYIRFILNDLKCYRSIPWSSTNHLLNSNSNIQRSFWVFGNQSLYCLVVCCFWVFDPLYFGGARGLTFSILFQFLVRQMYQ